MSEIISTSLPRSGPTFAEGSAEPFAGADDIRRAWYDGLAPDPLLSVSEWSEKHRMLAARASAEPGRYRIARTPSMRDILDALSPADPARRIVFMKAAQVGATEGANCFIGFIIHQAPGPALAVQPTVELAKRNSRQRIDPLIEESPALRDLVRPARSRDSGNTMLSKEFAGGILIMTGANSAVGLRSIPARYILLDEVDAYPASADEEGDPVTLAEARSLTFAHRRKVLLISTPTVKGFSRIEREYEASDQRRYFVPCPHCGHKQWLKFERLRWDKGKPETAAYHCEACETPIAEHHKTAMLAAGEWRATGTAADPSTIGFHLSALYSPVGWLSWEAIARAWIAAQGSDGATGSATGSSDLERVRAFRNTILGETWVESGEAPDWQRLYDRRERWAPGTVPAGGLFLTAGVDIQKDRIEVDVWAWGRGLESWLIDHIVIEGGPERTEPRAALDRLLSQVWPHENGAVLGLAKLAIDTGYEPTAVYGWARRAGVAQVAPVKGTDGFNRSSPVSGPTYVDASDGGKRLRRGAALDRRRLDLQGRDLPVPAAGTADRRGARRGQTVSARQRASAALGRGRVAQAVRRRAAGDSAHTARLRPARMAEAQRTQRGAGLPGLCPGRRLDRRRRPLPGAPLAAHGSGTGRRHGSRTDRHEGRGGIGSRLPPGGTPARDPQQVDGLRHGGHDVHRRAGAGAARGADLRRAYRFL